MVVSSGIYRRHKLKLFAFPWRLACVADARVPLSARRQILKRFLAARHCCLAFGLARQLRERNLGVDELLGCHWQNFFCMMACLRTMQIMDVETRHRRNRAMTHMHKCWSHFVASYLNSEAKILLREW